jgi:long-chain acyl-CoA synthetase
MGERMIWRLWQNGVAAGHPDPAYLTETAEGWREVSWREAAERVEQYANGLLARGIGKGDAFAILARTTLEWALFDFALAHVGAVGAAIYANNSPKDVHYVLEHSESVGVLCEDAEQLAKVEPGRAELPSLRHVLTFDDLPALAAEGVAFAERNPGALEARTAEVDEDDIFTFIYTSGTTGPPKACMIRHRNYAEMVRIAHSVRLTEPGDTLLLFLPLAHNYGRLLHLLAPYIGFTIAFVPEPTAVVQALDAVRPTVLPSVPRVYEKVHTAVLGRFDEATGLRRRLIDWSLAVGRRVSELEQAGTPVPRSLRARHRVAHRLVFRKARAVRRTPPRCVLGRRAPLARNHRVLRRARHPHPRGLRLDRVHHRGDRQPTGPLPVRHRRLRAPGRRATPCGGRRAADPQSDGVRRLLPGSRGNGGRARRRGLALLR